MHGPFWNFPGKTRDWIRPRCSFITLFYWFSTFGWISHTQFIWKKLVFELYVSRGWPPVSSGKGTSGAKQFLAVVLIQMVTGGCSTKAQSKRWAEVAKGVTMKVHLRRPSRVKILAHSPREMHGVRGIFSSSTGTQWPRSLTILHECFYSTDQMTKVLPQHTHSSPRELGWRMEIHLSLLQSPDQKGQFHPSKGLFA